LIFSRFFDSGKKKKDAGPERLQVCPTLCSVPLPRPGGGSSRSMAFGSRGRPEGK